MGVVFKKGGPNKDEARNKQGPSKEDFCKKNVFIQLATP
jgi:hypothetical protein